VVRVAVVALLGPPSGEVELLLDPGFEEEGFAVVGEFAEEGIGGVVDDDEGGADFYDLALGKLEG
jgi:hypothetical protein